MILISTPIVIAIPMPIFSRLLTPLELKRRTKSSRSAGFMIQFDLFLGENLP